MKLMRIMVIMIISPLFLTGCGSISSWWSGKPQATNSTPPASSPFGPQIPHNFNK